MKPLAHDFSNKRTKMVKKVKRNFEFVKLIIKVINSGELALAAK